jgi:hypothetical protein
MAAPCLTGPPPDIPKQANPATAPNKRGGDVLVTFPERFSGQ